MKINVDIRELSKLAKKLESMASKAVPHAVRNTLNGAAFEGRRILNERLTSDLTLRNTWTTRGTIVDKARGTNVRTMQATLGNTRPYVGGLEEGRVNRPRSGKAVAVPTPSAAGQGGAKRTKVVRRANLMSSIHLQRRVGLTPKQQNAIAIRQAAKGNHFVYLAFDGGRRGIFSVTGSKRPRIRMLYDLSRHTTTVKPRRLMAQTLRELEPKLAGIAVKALEEQLRRYGVR